MNQIYLNDQSTESRDSRNTVAYEARLLKCHLLKIIGWP